MKIQKTTADMGLSATSQHNKKTRNGTQTKTTTIIMFYQVYGLPGICQKYAKLGDKSQPKLLDSLPSY